MSLSERRFQIEPRIQLEKWLQQIMSNPDAVAANMDVARRLISHGLATHDKIGYLRRRVETASSETERLRADNANLLSIISDAHSALTQAEEINPSNYNHEQVCEMNYALAAALGILGSVKHEQREQRG